MRQAPQTKESRRLEIQEVIMPDPHRRLYILQLESGHWSMSMLELYIETKVHPKATGEGPSRGHLRDCDIFANLCLAFKLSSKCATLTTVVRTGV